MTFDVEYALELLPALLAATSITLVATAGGMTVALAAGLPLAIAVKSTNRVVASAARGFIEFVRTTPLLIQLFFVYYVLPEFGLFAPALPTGIVVIGLHYSTFLAEVYRAGIEGVPRGQWEASVAASFSRSHTWRRIILPQAIPPMVPVFGNYLIMMFKDTSLLATLTVLELTGTAMAAAAISLRYLEPLTIAALIYLVLSYSSAVAVGVVAKRIERRRTGPRLVVRQAVQ